jgi:hypothetical protein
MDLFAFNDVQGPSCRFGSTVGLCGLNYAMVKDGFVSPDMEAELSGGAV